MKVAEYIREKSKSMNDTPSFADLAALSGEDGEAPVVDPVAAEKAAKRAELQAQLDALG
jgi:hypothetical protein